MIYLDNCATTEPDEEVLHSFLEANRLYYANPASIHAAGKKAEALLTRARRQVLQLIGPSFSEGIFTSGGTEANNLAIIGLALANAHRGKHVITSKIEHPSVLNAFHYLEQNGFEVDYLSVDQEGTISVDELTSLLRSDTILVSIMHVNNEIGTIQPIEQCADVIHSSSRAVFHSDCVQSFGKIPLPFDKHAPDAITLSAHKIYGLKGSGFLAFRKGLTFVPFSFGGGQEQQLRNGTVSVPNAVALAKAMRLCSQQLPDFEQWRKRLIDKFAAFDNVKILAPTAAAHHILAVAYKGITGEVAVNFFGERGIYVSTSSACSSKSKELSHVVQAIGVEQGYERGVIRISFGKNNSDDEIAQFEEAIQQFGELLQRGIYK